MKIIDLIEATTPNPWKPIAQQPNGHAIINLLLKSDYISNTTIPHDAKVQELIGKDLSNLSPPSVQDNYIYLIMGIPDARIRPAHLVNKVAKFDEGSGEYIVSTLHPGTIRDGEKYGSSYAEEDSLLYPEYQLQDLISLSSNTWLISWPDNARVSKEIAREKLKGKNTNTPAILSKQLEPLKLSIITQAVIQLKRSNSQGMNLVSAIRSAVAKKQDSIKVGRSDIERYLSPLNIESWWKIIIGDVLRTHRSKGYTHPYDSKERLDKIRLDSPVYPAGLFAKLPAEIVKEIVSWADQTKFTIQQNSDNSA